MHSAVLSSTLFYAFFYLAFGDHYMINYTVYLGRKVPLVQGVAVPRDVDTGPIVGDLCNPGSGGEAPASV